MEPKKPLSHIVAGLIISGVLIIFSLIIYFLGLQNSWINYLQYGIIIAGLAIFINLYGNAKNNNVSFGNLFSYGFKTTAFIALLVIAFFVIFFLAFPDVKEKGFEVARQKMEEQGNLTQDQIDQAMGTFRKAFWVITIGGIIFIYAVVGAAGSLLGAAITKKNPTTPFSFDQQNRQ
ncbi:MAG: DUF4199 domain-containing protein [Chitinophagaceae bacterium]|jgi:magnesium-transporting ATPase (P-type)|nr:DUF4199 domain-containing protein [Chitinophagaceae bacterium]OQY94361.1 MAG: hypothetical protein B6D37_08905 [Sphingobacteriales bacterium UTBCD1]